MTNESKVTEETVDFDEGKYKDVKLSVMKNRIVEIANLIERNAVEIDDLVDLTKESNEISKVMSQRLGKIKAMIEE